MIIKDVPYFSQRDNKIEPYITCYPTSMAMAMQFCMNYIGVDKKMMGCEYDVQLEDYLSGLFDSAETKAWIKKNVSRFGTWLLKYRPRTIAVVEEMMFNKLFSNLPFKCTFKELPFQDFKEAIARNQIPTPIHGDFSSITSVGGHICCAIGYHGEKIIVHDPYGEATTGYKKKHGENVAYDKSIFLKKGKILFQSIKFTG